MAPLRAMRLRLDEEASARPPVPLRVEASFDAFEKDGIKLERKRQQLGTPYLASFCMSAHTGVKVQLTVCEHESEERADENVKALQKLERPERRVVKNGTTTLLIRRDLNNEAEAPLVDKLVRAFEHLGPAPVDP